MKSAITIAICTILALFLPIIPVHHPAAVWSESEFLRKKPEVQELAKRLSAIAPEFGKTLSIDYGESSAYRAIIGPAIGGDKSFWIKGHAFGVSVPQDCPYLDYKRPNFATIPAKNYEAFANWADLQIENGKYEHVK
jgi:hypothetical protein